MVPPFPITTELRSFVVWRSQLSNTSSPLAALRVRWEVEQGKKTTRVEAIDKQGTGVFVTLGESNAFVQSTNQKKKQDYLLGSSNIPT